MSPQERWDAFLAKIKTRSDEILAEAVEGSAQFLEQPEVDQNALGRIWTVIRHRMSDLRGKIEDTWGGSVMDLFEGAAQDRARMQGQDLDAALENDFERAEARAYADVGRWIAKRAAEMRVTDAKCMHCGSPHSVVGVRFTYEWTCASCKATATFQPSTFEYQLEGAAAYIAKDRAFDAELAAKRDRGERRAYWQLYLATMAELLPERAATIEADVASKLAEPGP